MRFALVIIFIFFFSSLYAQKVYELGSSVYNFEAPVVLNHLQQKANLQTLSAKITILDFFGTWCVPCIKALPQLEQLQKQHSQSVRVVLISTETTERLQKFIASRPSLSFPVIVDKASAITSLFAPPSFPYTVVLNANNQIVAITEASSITFNLIEEWLVGKRGTLQIMNEPTKKTAPISEIMDPYSRSNNKIIALSQNLMYAVKTGENSERYINELAAINYDELLKGLSSDDQKKAFWINAYNGFTQALLKKNPETYKKRNTFFKSKQLVIANNKFSLDDIEHGILRRNKVKWSLGYFNKWFPRKINRQLKVDKLDPRIHFALNCGAKSCPPLAFYDAEKLNKQLDIATTVYLTGEVVYEDKKNTLLLPAIMGWFRRDFGGKKKMLQLVQQQGIVPANKKPSIWFNTYDWNLDLNNYQ
ncbi:MAG: DUF547 domain-containing protein [Ferruginibacter sp.]